MALGSDSCGGWRHPLPSTPVLVLAPMVCSVLSQLGTHQSLRGREPLAAPGKAAMKLMGDSVCGVFQEKVYFEVVPIFLCLA